MATTNSNRSRSHALRSSAGTAGGSSVGLAHDAQLKKAVEALKRSFDETPGAATAFGIEVGIYTKSGRLSKRFGGT